MSIDLTLPGGKQVEIINTPLRSVAPILQVAAQCQPELEQLWRDKNEMLYRTGSMSSAERWVEAAKHVRETLLPRTVEVRQAFDMLSSIYHGEQNIDTPLALQMVS